MKAHSDFFKGLLIVLMLFALTGTTYADAPVITSVSLVCNDNGTLTVSATATDADGDLVKLELWVSSYSGEFNCTQNVSPTNTNIHTKNWAPPGVPAGTETKTVTCTSCQWYRAYAVATDNAGNVTTSSKTACCHCYTSGQVSYPTLSQWVLILLALSVAGFFVWQLKRRRKAVISLR